MEALWNFQVEAALHQIDFACHNVVKEHESYCGRFATVRYLIRMSSAPDSEAI